MSDDMQIKARHFRDELTQLWIRADRDLGASANRFEALVNAISAKLYVCRDHAKSDCRFREY